MDPLSFQKRKEVAEITLAQSHMVAPTPHSLFILENSDVALLQSLPIQNIP